MRVLEPAHLVVMVLEGLYLIALFFLLILNTVNIIRTAVSSCLSQREQSQSSTKRKNSNHSLTLLLLLYPCFFAEITGSIVILIEYSLAETLPGGWKNSVVAALVIVNFGLRGLVTLVFNVCTIFQVSFVFARAEHMARLNVSKEHQFKVYKGFHIAGTIFYVLLNTLHMTATLIVLYFYTVSPEDATIAILSSAQFGIAYVIYIFSMLAGFISLLVTGIKFTRRIKSTNKIQQNNNVGAAFKKVCLLLLLLESYTVFHVLALVSLGISHVSSQWWLVPYYLLLQTGELVFMFGLNLIHSPLYALGAKVTQAVGTTLRNKTLFRMKRNSSVLSQNRRMSLTSPTTETSPGTEMADISPTPSSPIPPEAAEPSPSAENL